MRVDTHDVCLFTIGDTPRQEFSKFNPWPNSGTRGNVVPLFFALSSLAMKTPRLRKVPVLAVAWWHRDLRHLSTRGGGGTSNEKEGGGQKGRRGGKVG